MGVREQVGSAAARFVGLWAAGDYDAIRELVVEDEQGLLAGPAPTAPADARATRAVVEEIGFETPERAVVLVRYVMTGGGERRSRRGFVDLERGPDGEWRVRPSTLRSRVDGGDRPIERLRQRLREQGD